MASRSSRSGGGSRSSFSSGGSRSSFSSSRSSSRSSFSSGPSLRRSSSSSSGYHRHHHVGHTVHHHVGYGHNSHVHIKMGPIGGLVFGFIFFIILASVFISSFTASINNAIQDMNVSKTAYTKYQNMISRAEKDEKYRVKGTIDYIRYDDVYDKYYIEYSFIDSENEKYTQLSYAMYDYSDYITMNPGDSIDIALSEPYFMSDQFTDSINMDFKYVDLDNFAEYQDFDFDFKFAKIGKLVVIVASAVIFIIFIIAFRTAIKKKSSDNENSSTTSTSSTTNSTTQDNTQKDQYCAYCGSKISSSDTKCPLCGAQNKR